MESKDHFIPSVRFELAPVDQEANLLLGFAAKDRWASVFERFFPHLHASVAAAEQKSEKLAICRRLVDEKREKAGDKLSEALGVVDADWQPISREFLKALSDHFETAWPTDKPVMIGYISVLPVYPRFLDSYSFYVGFRNPAAGRETTAHEILHFLWFKKWKEVFPDSKREQFESPHLVWRLSEVMDPIILQCHPHIKELIKPEKWGYSSFEGLKIGDMGMTQHFAQIYSDCLGRGESFDVILRTLWNEAQEHRDVLGAF